MDIFSKFKDYSLKESSREVKNFIGSVKTSLAKLNPNKSLYYQSLVMNICLSATVSFLDNKPLIFRVFQTNP